mmetsp:Transcript_29075/g.53199  ORF Transcript_29075/g.53199 Transcript_29075/m.53199 type:complete len:202 (-) Transcript_29075:1951-2556(-)
MSGMPCWTSVPIVWRPYRRVESCRPRGTLSVPTMDSLLTEQVEIAPESHNNNKNRRLLRRAVFQESKHVDVQLRYPVEYNRESFGSTRHHYMEQIQKLQKQQQQLQCQRKKICVGIELRLWNKKECFMWTIFAICPWSGPLLLRMCWIQLIFPLLITRQFPHGTRPNPFLSSFELRGIMTVDFRRIETRILQVLWNFEPLT